MSKRATGIALCVVGLLVVTVLAVLYSIGATQPVAEPTCETTVWKPTPPAKDTIIGNRLVVDVILTGRTDAFGNPYATVCTTETS